jgi:hypothetical protein
MFHVKHRAEGGLEGVWRGSGPRQAGCTSEWEGVCPALPLAPARLRFVPPRRHHVAFASAGAGVL